MTNYILLQPSTIVKHSIVLHGHKTSISMESAIWDDFKGIARALGMTITALATEIDDKREHKNLSSAIRLYVLAHHKAAAQVVTQARTVQ